MLSAGLLRVARFIQRAILVVIGLASFGCEHFQKDPFYLGIAQDEVLYLKDENPTVEDYLLDLVTITKVTEVSYSDYLDLKQRLHEELQPIYSSPEELVATEFHGNYVYFCEFETQKYPMEGGGLQVIEIRHRYKARIP